MELLIRNQSFENVWPSLIKGKWSDGDLTIALSVGKLLMEDILNGNFQVIGI